MRVALSINRLLWSASYVLVFPTVALGTDDDPSQIHEPVFGVEDWFDGCAQLSNNTVMSIPKMALDMDCVAWALDYCTNKQENSYQDICHETLIDHIHLRSAEISEELPENPNLKGFKRSSYEKARQRAADVSQSKCDAEMSENECKLLDATLRWLDLRIAERLLEGNRQ
ncbi:MULTISPECIES: hypothetical protein [unclassified Ruegeria]|uniref:hypothetical protein n=1 Tax=unclassified Ruegeria TaxID=2625375 RepID=UPI0014876467|nr:MULTISPECIES: hypothetical protein [unclassified Ruegeria]NOD61803.1 hypothetical protein [Ruegeria sp. HKCCD6109]